MTLGETIARARKKKGLSLEELGEAVGMSRNVPFLLEKNAMKRGADPLTLIRISEALDAPEILIHHCDTCPIRNHIMLKLFPDLNNIRRDPATMVSKLRKEMVEATAAAERLSERYMDVDFRSRPDYRETFEREMEQIIDVKRNIEALEFELILSGLHTREDIDRVYERQQKKCEEHGHHRPAKTGTEG